MEGAEAPNQPAPKHSAFTFKFHLGQAFKVFGNQYLPGPNPCCLVSAKFDLKLTIAAQADNGSDGANDNSAGQVCLYLITWAELSFWRFLGLRPKSCLPRGSERLHHESADRGFSFLCRSVDSIGFFP
jgi:hypothetical protein